MIYKVERFKRQGCEKINDEPSPQIVHGNQFLLCDNPAGLFVNVSCMKVDEDIDDEENFDNAVSYDQLSSMIVGFKGYIKRDHNGYVADKDQYDPVPN